MICIMFFDLWSFQQICLHVMVIHIFVCIILQMSRQIADCEEPGLNVDLRRHHGDNDQFKVFLEETEKYLTEYIGTPVHERRHSESLYLAKPISMKDLHQRIQERVPPSTPVPSVKWLRYQFQPRHPNTCRWEGPSLSSMWGLHRAFGAKALVIKIKCSFENYWIVHCLSFFIYIFQLNCYFSFFLKKMEPQDFKKTNFDCYLKLKCS